MPSVTGPLVFGRVDDIEELTEFKKPIRFCKVDVGDANGTGEQQGIICGARNFAEGDVVVVALPGAVLPGDFAIGARETYGRISAGMLCSEAELGLTAQSAGIIALPTSVLDDADATEHSSSAASDQEIPVVLDAVLTRSGDGLRIAVTISSPYDTPERYADGWRVMIADGEVLAEHDLARDHADEQPFTRSRGPFAIPDGVDEVVVEGRDQANGYGGDTVTVTVPE